jgi:hypothetical protein
LYATKTNETYSFEEDLDKQDGVVCVGISKEVKSVEDVKIVCPENEDNYNHLRKHL